MDINNLRRIGARLKEEISSHLDGLRKGAPIGKGASGDITHQIDKKAEDIVIEEVEYLGEPITLVSEECGVRSFSGGGPILLLDPVDGSRNAISGVPLFSTSIALVDGNRMGDTALGYVVNLISGDEFWALKKKGSYRNGIPIRTQEDTVLRVIAYEAQSPKADIPGIISLLTLFKRARCFGSTALDMAFLAQGALSVFIVPSPSRSFDFAAGYLLVKEAGGMVTDMCGGDIDDVIIGIERSVPILASANEGLHTLALEALQNS